MLVCRDNYYARLFFYTVKCVNHQIISSSKLLMLYLRYFRGRGISDFTPKPYIYGTVNLLAKEHAINEKVSPFTGLLCKMHTVKKMVNMPHCCVHTTRETYHTML